MSTISHWIDGAAVTVPDARTQPVFNPATGEVTGQLQLADTALVDRAVAAGGAAAPARRRGAAARPPPAHDA